MDFDAENQNLIGIFTTDTELVVQVWDAALERMTGISADHARHRSLTEIIPDLETRGLFTRFKGVLEEGTFEILAPAFHGYLIAAEPQFASEHFQEMRQRVTIAPLREDETICGLIVTIEDVTQRMENEIELAGRLKDSDETVRLKAAKAILHETEKLGAENAAPLIEGLSDKSWRVRRALVKSLSRRAAPEAISALLQAMRERYFDFGVLNSALQILQETSFKTTETLIEFLQSENADLRMQAALTLGEQKDPQAIPALLAALQDENTNVRYHAIEALAKLKAADAVEPLLEMAEARDFFLSFAALDALRQFADETVSKRLIPLLQDDLLRDAAIETLGDTGQEEIVRPLVDLLNRHKSAAVAAAKALINLIARFEDDLTKSSNIIERAQKAIKTSGITNLLESFEEAVENDLIVIVRLSGWFDDPKIREKLAGLLEIESLREAAAQALIRQGEAAADLLIEKLQAEDLKVRQMAARTLGNFKNERAVQALIEALEKDPELGTAAAPALGQTGDKRAFEPLTDFLKRGDAAGRRAAVEALKLLAHPETVQRLGHLLTDKNPGIRESAVRVVGYFNAAGCETLLYECCEDPDEHVQRAALEQLPNIRDERAVLILTDRLMQGSSPRIRAVAAQILTGGIPNEKSIAALRAALKDTDSWVRYFAVRALGTHQDTASRELFIEMSEKDAAEQVRVAAHEVLDQLKA